MKPHAATWFTSSYSGTSSNCVEVSGLGDATAVRDTKHRELGCLAFPAREWDAFIRDVKRDD